MPDKTNISEAIEETKHSLGKEKIIEHIKSHLGFNLESMGNNPAKEIIYYGLYL